MYVHVYMYIKYSFFFLKKNICAFLCAALASLDQAVLKLKILPVFATQVLELEVCATTS